MHPLFRFAPAAAIVALAACGSGGSNNNTYVPPPNYGGGYAQACAGTQVQLANPQNYQTASPNIGSITIVANGQNNTLYNNYGQFQLQLNGNYGDSFSGSSLQLVSDPNGPHPFASDFYYASSLQGQQLPTGETWTVTLFNYAQGCSVPIGTFQT